MSSSTLDSTTELRETRSADERRTDPDHSTGENDPASMDPDTAVVDPNRYRWLRRGTLLALPAGTAALYRIGLSASGWGNSFYAAAAQAGSQSWKAFFYGSLGVATVGVLCATVRRSIGRGLTGHWAGITAGGCSR